MGKFRWVQNGDINTFFFHSSVRIHKHANMISHIVDDYNHALTDKTQIENTFVDYFTNLLSESSSNSIPFLTQAFPNNLDHVSNSNREALISIVTKEEGFKTLMSLLAGKSLGPDGCNVEFYKFFWDDLGYQLFRAMKYFFDKEVSTLFAYLGVLISNKKVVVAHFQSLVDKVNLTIAGWN